MHRTVTFCGLLIAFLQILSLSAYDFYGRHFIASYKECNKASLYNIEELKNVFEKAVEASGATILTGTDKVFEGGGITITLVLSESHASIHTYPEHAACFVDLFTCGTSCESKAFDEVLRGYLQPETIDKALIVRE